MSIKWEIVSDPVRDDTIHIISSRLTHSLTENCPCKPEIYENELIRIVDHKQLPAGNVSKYKRVVNQLQSGPRSKLELNNSATLVVARGGFMQNRYPAFQAMSYR